MFLGRVVVFETETQMLDEKTVALAQGANYAVMSTKMADGSIQSHPMWVDSDGEHILLNTEIHRPKFKNVERDATITVLIQEAGDHFSWREVRGRVVDTVGGQEARDHIDALAKVYMGLDEYPNPITSERVILKVAPDRVTSFHQG